MTHPKTVKVSIVVALVMLYIMCGNEPGENFSVLGRVVAAAIWLFCMVLIARFWIIPEMKQGNEARRMHLPDPKPDKPVDGFNKQTWPRHGEERKAIEPFESYQ